MKGSILFNPDINIEVDVDPSAEEGARLISAKNLVDGQEAGGGGESGLITTSKDPDGPIVWFNASYTHIKNLLENGVIPYCYIDSDSAALLQIPTGLLGVFPVAEIEYNSIVGFFDPGEELFAVFLVDGETADSNMYIYAD